MACQTCKSERVMSFGAKCSDCFTADMNGKQYDGYVLDIPNFGGGDYIEGNLCLDCGQIQGTWPVPRVEGLEK